MILCRKVSAQLNVLQRLARYLDVEGRMAIFVCFIKPYFMYCSLVWHFCGAVSTKKLESLQYRALRFIYQDFQSSYDLLLSKAGMPTLETACLRGIVTEVYKSLHKLLPPFMWNMFEVKKHSYNLQRNDRLAVEHSRTVKYGH